MESHYPSLNLDLSLPWLGGDQKRDLDKSPEGCRDYISRLEQELRKMEVFETVLPLSISILTDALERMKEKVARNGDLDEIRTTRSEEDADKKSWMSSAQLWSADRTLSLQLNLNKPNYTGERKAPEYTDKVGAYSSFRNGPELSPPATNINLGLTKPGLRLLTSEPAGLSKVGVGRPSSEPAAGTDKLKLQSSSPADLLPPRKQRRCWSPELHRKFIDSLDRLGGPQEATPKQIRDMMQVTGLTNDEVKSHLQKYRLHLRKVPKSTMTNLSRNKLFLNQDSSLEGSGGISSGVINVVSNSKLDLNQIDSPEGPFQFSLRSAKGNSTASRCNSMEDDYEDKSESHNWEGETS